MDYSHKWLHYFKNSLSDSENLSIDLERIKNVIHSTSIDLSSGMVPRNQAESLIDAEERRINRLKGILKKENPNWFIVSEIQLTIAPFRLITTEKNEGFKQLPLYPFWITAKVNRSGQLSPPEDLFPLVVRNYLDPIETPGNSFIFSSLETVTQARAIESPLNQDESQPIEWAVYWSYVLQVFSSITFNIFSNYRAEGYHTSYQVCFFASNNKITTAKSILFLYDQLLNVEEQLPLLESLLSMEKKEREEAVTDAGFLNFNHLHLGQMSNEFPLSISQRKTLLSYLNSENHTITAVNGPPGTGKTTLLQSLVATEFVRSAIKGDEAPVIVACSTNNQAVTNIIDSFINSVSSMGLLSERWIPNFNGYATYLPSKSKSTKSLENINFLKGNLFGYQGTLCDLENLNYLDEASSYFLEKFYEYFEFNPSSIEEACNHLQEEVSLLEDMLINGVRISQDYITSISAVNNLLLRKEDNINQNSIQIVNIQQWRNLLTSLKNKFKANDFIEQLQTYFSVSSSNKESSKDALFRITDEALLSKENALDYLKKCIATFNLALQSNLKLNDWKLQYGIQGFPFISEETMWNYEYKKMEDKEVSHRFFYDEIDVKIRHKAFLLATHYWEARWILATYEMLEENTEKGTGENAIALQWRRRAMLTPCFVATFYMAPTHFLYSQYQGENEEGKPLFEYLPMYNFLDLLIIDEGGQATPEVSVPMFALAQKAMIVGDLQQIEPIWSIPQKIDIGNLLNAGLLEKGILVEDLATTGFLASSGSVMKMAQEACKFETTHSNSTVKGLVLLEHRRCNDEIISFCNELAYGGVLKPMKGSASEDQLFPSMMAYHISGISEQSYSSRFNNKEVNSIVGWLNRHKEAIEEAYQVTEIEQVLGIITPFTSQKNALAKALKDAGFNVSKIKLGTVHALQGAERHIVLFSSVYTSEDEGTLFFDKDNKPNMLNVAVSRARDSFILFGDMRVFDETNNAPSGVLKRHLQVHEMST
ncbi:MAG: AAA domain-containing protein [Flavicella sp.]